MKRDGVARGALGGLLVSASAALFAATLLILLSVPASAATTVLEAESMSLPAGSGQVFSDGGASGGKGLLIWSNSTATGQMDAPQQPDRLVVRARGDQCGTAPRMVVRVGDVQVMSRAVSASTWTDYSVAISSVSGAQTVEISYTNDKVRAGCDRNLRIDKVSFVSPTTSPTNPPSYGVNLAGGEFGSDSLPGTYNQDYTYPTAQELDYYKSKGRYVIRLPFRWERLQRTLNGSLDSTEMSRVDQVVADARARGMQVLLDNHNYGRYKINGTNEQILGTSQVPNSAFADFWRKVADRYKNESAIYGYGLMNEPHDMGDSARWPAAAQAAVNEIRKVDSTHTIFVAGDHWSGAQSWRTTSNENLNTQDPADKVVYEAHQYFDDNNSGTYDETYEGEGAYPTIGVDRARPFVEWLQAKGKKGFIGEFGVPYDDARWNTVLDNFLSYTRTNNVGGTYWAGGPWWGTYKLSIEPTNNFTTDKPQMSVLQKYPS